MTHEPQQPDAAVSSGAGQETSSLLQPSLWVERYGDYLYRYALSRLRDEHLAEDAVQETFLSALKAIPSFEGRSAEKTWLVGILKHKIIDIFRKCARESPENSLTALPFEKESLFFDDSHEWSGHWTAEGKPLDWGETPLDAVERKDFQRVLQSCFEKLSPRSALVFTLKEIDDMDCKEICAQLDISESNLWVMLHRARMHLRRCLELRWFAKAK